MPDAFQILNEIRKYYGTVREDLSLTYVHERLKKRFKIGSRQVGRFLAHLHKIGRIEMVNGRVRPVGELKSGTVNEKDIKDVLWDLKRAKPVQAYQHFLNKFSVFVNPETFTRLMRRMGEEGIIHRNDLGYYSLKKDLIQKRLME